jgi:DNA-binding transcriptional regulator YiaG
MKFKVFKLSLIIPLTSQKCPVKLGLIRATRILAKGGDTMTEWNKEAILNLRTSLNLTQKVFAERLGITNIYVSYLEKGIKHPSKTLCILLDCLKSKTEKEDKGNG